MKKIEIPELTDFRLNTALENKILRLNEKGFHFYSLVKDIANWKNNYEIIHVEDKEERPATFKNNYYWIKQLKGVKFYSKEEAELYAFLDYCQKQGELWEK